MKTQESRSLQHHRYLAQAPGRHQQCTKSQNQPIPRGQIRTPALRTLHDEQLVLDRQRLGSDRTNAAGTGQPRQGHQQVSNQPEPQRHALPEFNALPPIRKPALRDRPVPELAIRHTQDDVDCYHRSQRRAGGGLADLKLDDKPARAM